MINVCIDPNIQNVLRMFIHRSNVFVIALNFTSNICSRVINYDDETVSKLYRKKFFYQYKAPIYKSS